MNLCHLPGAVKNAKATPSLECKALTRAGAATRHLRESVGDLRVSATKIVLVIQTINAEPRGEWTSTNKVSHSAHYIPGIKILL